MAYVYLICDSGQDNTFKIGVTRGSIENRIKKLQTGNGSEIFLVNYYETDYPFLIEKMMHQKHCSDKKLNEWFYLDTEGVKNFKNDCEDFEKTIENLKDNPFFKKNIK